MPDAPRFVPLEFQRLPEGEQLARSRRFLASMRRRRTVRRFARELVSDELVENAIATAGTAPSGAHQQPWTFVVVSDPDVKRRIGAAAEAEERRSYESRMPDEWLEALRPLGTDWRKAHLEHAPAWWSCSSRRTACARTARASSTTTSASRSGSPRPAARQPAQGRARDAHAHAEPAGVPRRVLGRPENERPYVVVPVGYPAAGCTVPDLVRKPVEAILVRR